MGLRLSSATKDMYGRGIRKVLHHVSEGLGEVIALLILYLHDFCTGLYERLCTYGIEVAYHDIRILPMTQQCGQSTVTANYNIGIFKKVEGIFPLGEITSGKNNYIFHRLYWIKYREDKQKSHLRSTPTLPFFCYFSIMLRKFRIVLAVLFFIGITLLLVGIGQQWWGWMAKLQFLPSCLAGNFIVIGGILLLTLLFGRLYCSVICPLGVFQDLVIWLRRRIGLAANKINVKRAIKAAQARKEGRTVESFNQIKPEVKHFKFNKEHWIPRYAILVLTLVAIFADIQLLVALIAPYSAYGRIVHSIAGLAQGQSILPALLIVAAATLVIISVSAWLWGRAWCNNVCPVGTVLGLVSKASLFKVRIDPDKCNACGRCGRGCKSSCIDMDAHTIDHSRCVDCFDCIERCSGKAIYFGIRKPMAENHQPSGSATRRDFLATAAVILGAGSIAHAQEKRRDGGLAEIADKQAPERYGKLVPPGAQSAEEFYSKCTACQLCVANCPNGILRPSKDLAHLLQPEMGYENGFCRPECTVCGEVCPTGAVKPVSKEEKLTIHIGTAAVNEETCIGCGKCNTICPTGAIIMVNEDGKKLATVVESVCIGCGKCEFLCPVRPISAITVNGLEEHRHDE